MPLESFWAFLSFKNPKHSHTETVKKHYQQINFVKKLYFEPLLTDITDSGDKERLFERTQQHGGCTKPLGIDKFA